MSERAGFSVVSIETVVHSSDPERSRPIFKKALNEVVANTPWIGRIVLEMSERASGSIEPVKPSTGPDPNST